MVFIDIIIEKVKLDIKIIVFFESYEERNLKVVFIVLKEKIVKIVLIGKEDEIKKEVEKYGVNIDDVIFIDLNNFDRFDEFVNVFYELRKNKGVILEDVRKIMKDLMYFGVMFVYKGLVDGMVFGVIYLIVDILWLVL